MQITTTPGEYYIIDAEHLLYRNYYANMKLHTITGKKSGAFYGFFSSLKALNDRVGAEKIIVTWGDKRNNLVRREYFAEYKGDRSDTAEDFIYQRDDVIKVCGNLNIPQYFAVNYEADDVIGLLCMKLRKKYPNSHINILTGDKDLTQLVTKHISILRPDNTTITLENLKEVTGLEKPKHVAWFLALQGDKADCVPGIEGIGPVKAKQIIYGTDLQNCKNYDDVLAWALDHFKTTEEADNFVKSATLVDIIHSPLSIFNDDSVQIVNKSKTILSNVYSAQETLDSYEVKQYSADALPQYIKKVETIQLVVKNCMKCPELSRHRTHIVPSVLTENSDILFVTDSPGKEDDISGTEILLDKAGRLFDKMLKNIGVQRHDDPNIKISISSICRCHPKDNRDLSSTEISNCLPYLWRDIEYAKPKLVIPMGNTALRAILGDNKISIQNMRGKVFAHKGIMLAPTWHPTYIDKAPTEQSVWENDIRSALKWVKGDRESEKVDYKVIQTVDELREYIERLKQFPTNSFDYETAGFMPNIKIDGGEALCIVLSAKPRESRLFPFYGQFLKEIRPPLENAKAKALLKDWLENTPDIVKIAHNAEYENRWSVQWLGVTDIPNLQCTQLMHAAIDENSLHGLKDLSVRFTDIDRYEDDVKKWSKWHNHSKERYFTDKPPFGADNYAYVPDDVLWEYALIDADAAHRLYPIFLKEIYRQDLQEFVYKYYFKWMKFFARVKMRGFKVDMPYLIDMIATYEKRIEQAKKDLYSLPEIKRAEQLVYEKRIREEVEKISARYDKLKNKRYSKAGYLQKYVYDKIHPEPFNFNSPKHQPVLFYDVLKLKQYKSEKGNPSFGKETMEKYQEEGVPFINQLSELTALEKFLSTFLKGAMNNIYGDRLHTDLRLDIAVTGRLSSSNPNLQNIPKRSNPEKAKEIRDMFIAEDGYMILAKDYGQMEFRVWAQYSQDPQMLADLNAGVDIHRFIASQIYKCAEADVTKEQRETAKNCVFGVMYGRGVRSISKQYGISEEEATRIQRTFFARYPKAEQWIRDNLQFAKKHGYVVNLYGRKRHLQATINSPIKGVRGNAERKATNSPIQGGASDTNNLAAMLCQRRFDEEGIDGHIQLLVHDQIVACVRKDQVIYANQLMDAVMAKPTNRISVKLISDSEVGYRFGSLVDFNEYKEKGDAAFAAAA